MNLDELERKARAALQDYLVVAPNGISDTVYRIAPCGSVKPTVEERRMADLQ